MKKSTNLFYRLGHVIFLLFLPAAFAQPIEEIIVTVDYIPDEKLQTAEVSDILDAEDISIAGDSNVGDSLKRLPGLSLVDGKFIYVRGLGERYSSTYFNGTAIPSPIPMQRSVPLDIFGTSIIQNLLVQKTYSPNYGAEFSGGIVDIRSSAIPDEGFFSIKASAGYNNFSTNEDGYTYEGGSNDWRGSDDGTRSMPGPVASLIDYYPNVFGVPTNDLTVPSVQEQDLARLSFNNTLDIKTRSNPYDLSLSLGAGNRWSFDNYNFGATLRLSLDNKTRNSTIQRTRHSANNLISENNLSDSEHDLRHASVLDNGNLLSTYGFTPGELNRTVNTIRFNQLITLGWEIEDNHIVKVTKLRTKLTNDEASINLRRRTNSDRQLWRDHRLSWTENELSFFQISGESIFENLDVSWRWSDIDAGMNTPDQRTYRTVEDDLWTEDEEGNRLERFGLNGRRHSTYQNGGISRGIYDGSSVVSTIWPGSINLMPPTDISYDPLGNIPLSSYLSLEDGQPVREYISLDGVTEEKGIDFVWHFYPNNIFESIDVKFGYLDSNETRAYNYNRFTYELDGLIIPKDDNYVPEVSLPNGFVLVEEQLIESSNVVPYIRDIYHPYLFRPIEELLDSSNCQVNGIPAESSTAVHENYVGQTDECFIATSIQGRSSAVADTGVGAISFREGYVDGSPDKYDGALGINAHYLAFDLALPSGLRIHTGYRQEKSIQSITLGNINNEVNAYLPAFSMTLPFDDVLINILGEDYYFDMQIRAAFSESINRPLMRELAAVQTYSALDGREYVGNPDLQTAYIRSKDIRYELYFGENDYMSLSYFEKEINNAIELQETDQGDQDSLFTWTNIPNAANDGFEFEIRKYIGDFWFLTANATNISSEVTLNEDLLSRGQRQGRPMSGLSEELYNLQIVYESEDTTMSLAFNTFSKRLFANLDVPGGNGEGELYEDPFKSLDFNLQKYFNIDRHELVFSWKIRNLLDEEKVIRSSNGMPYDKYEVGISTSLGFSWKMY